jgi:hypothetical protein
MEPSPFRIIDIAWKEQVPSGKDVGATNGPNYILLLATGIYG